MNSSEGLNLIDRTELEFRGEIACEEILVIECPKCGQLTVGVLTTQFFKYYAHNSRENDLELNYCVQSKKNDFIPDELLYVQEVQGDNDSVNVSRTILHLW